MQVFGNVATAPERKESKTTGKAYWQMRLCEAQRGVDKDPSFYTVRIMKSEDPGLAVGDFLRVTGKLKADFYLSREGRPTGTLLIIAFEAAKIAKPSVTASEALERDQAHPSAEAAKALPAASAAPSVPLPAAPASSSEQTVPPARVGLAVEAQRQLTSLQALPAFTLPMPVASRWSMSLGPWAPAK